MRWLSLTCEDLCALKRTLTKNIHAVALITLLNNYSAIHYFNDLDSVKDDVELILIKSVEHESLEKFGFELVFLLISLVEHWRSEVFLLVVSTKDFCRDTGTLLTWLHWSLDFFLL